MTRSSDDSIVRRRVEQDRPEFRRLQRHQDDAVHVAPDDGDGRDKHLRHGRCGGRGACANAYVPVATPEMVNVPSDLICARGRMTMLEGLRHRQHETSAERLTTGIEGRTADPRRAGRAQHDLDAAEV